MSITGRMDDNRPYFFTMHSTKIDINKGHCRKGITAMSFFYDRLDEIRLKMTIYLV